MVEPNTLPLTALMTPASILNFHQSEFMRLLSVSISLFRSLICSFISAILRFVWSV